MRNWKREEQPGVFLWHNGYAFSSQYFLHILICLAEISMECARENMVAASAHLHQSHGVPFDEIVYIVTCDGTWCKHRFTATYGNRSYSVFRGRSVCLSWAGTAMGKVSCLATVMTDDSVWTVCWRRWSRLGGHLFLQPIQPLHHRL